MRQDSEFFEAAELARASEMRLIQTEPETYHLSPMGGEWGVSIYPARNGVAGRLKHDEDRRGPLMPLPRHWNLIDVVQAAIKAGGAKADTASEGDRKMRIRRETTETL